MRTYHAEADIFISAVADSALCALVAGLLQAVCGAAVGQSLHDKHAIAVSLAVDADDPPSAERQAFAVIMDALNEAGVDALETLDMRVVRWDLFEAEVAEPNYPDLVGTTEAATMLGVSRQRVHQLMRENRAFPDPLYNLNGTGPLWVRQGIELFERRWTRRPGRPPKAPAAEQA